MNASNAMLDSKDKRIAILSMMSGTRRAIRVYDTGVGIDLAKAESLFEPLKRDLKISAERRALGYGGSGLGLAIVQMLARDLMADVGFIRPEGPFNTCFELEWTEGVMSSLEVLVYDDHPEVASILGRKIHDVYPNANVEAVSRQDFVELIELIRSQEDCVERRE